MNDRLYKKKTSNKQDGVAIFWKPEKFHLVQHHQLELDNPVGDESGKLGTNRVR